MAWHAKRRQRAVEDAERAAETERRVLDRQRGFVRDASHELRTPITVARGHAELIRTMSDDARSSADAEVVISELDRLSRLSDGLLTLAAADHPSFLSTSPVCVDELLTETAARWGPASERELRVTLGAGGTVAIDRGRIEAALDALIENAVRASEPGSAIELASVPGDGTVTIAVTDHGTGIAPEDLPHVFDRFARGDAGRARGSGGTGLGLAIVQAIVEAHGGTVEAVSRPGAGTTMRLRLPGYVSGDGPVPGSAVAVAEGPPLPATL
jgi:signal transduction histidine kinase